MSVKLRRALLLLFCIILTVSLIPSAFADDGKADSEASPVTVIFYSDDDSALPYITVLNSAGNEYAPTTNSDTGAAQYGRYQLMPGEYSYTFHDDAGRYEDTAGSFTVDAVYMLFEELSLSPIIQMQSFSFNYVNPIYDDVITEDDFPEPTISQEELEAEAYSLAKRYSGGNRRTAAFYSDSGTTYTSYSSAGADLKQQLLRREATAIIRMQVSGKISTEEQLKSITDSIFSYAIAHTQVPTEGDYIRYEYGGYKAGAEISYTTSSNTSVCVITFTPVYYTTAAQESQVNTKANNILSSLDLSGKSDYQKVRAIYDYLCEHVSYDNTNLNNDAYKLKYTAYAALINNTAVCQGYSCAFYRLCLAAGVDTRIITSTEMVHAWNIARVNGKYYELDSTWDETRTPGTYRYFLKSDSFWLSYHTSNGNSTLGDQFDDSSFKSAYPLSTTNFENLSAVPVDSSPSTLKSKITDLPDLLAGQTKLMANGANDIERFRVSVSSKAVGSTTGDASRTYDTAVSVAAYKSGSMLAETRLDQSRLADDTAYSFSLSVPSGWAGKKINYTRSGWGAANESGTLTASSGSSPTVSFSSFAHLGRFVLEPVKYTVTFNVNGGSTVAAQTVINGNKAAKPADPTRSGYWFAGWYTSTAYTSAYNFDTAVSANTTVYARWIVIESNPAALKDAITNRSSVLSELAAKVTGGAGSIDRFLVSVSAKAVNSGTDNLSRTYDVAVSAAAYKGSSMLAETLLDQTKLSSSAKFSFSLVVPDSWNGRTLSYTRSGWGAADERGTVSASGSAAAFNSVSRLGRYTLKPVYSFTFQTNGGSTVAAQSIIAGEKASKPAAPKKDGSWFVGWYTDSRFTKAFSFDTAVTADTTVYAKWAVPDFILPAGLSEIGKEAFEGSAFTFAVLPENTAAIGRRAFANCANLDYIYIPAGAAIDPEAFEGVEGLTIFGSSQASRLFADRQGFVFLPAAG